MGSHTSSPLMCIVQDQNVSKTAIAGGSTGYIVVTIPLHARIRRDLGWQYFYMRMLQKKKKKKSKLCTHQGAIFFFYLSATSFSFHSSWLNSHGYYG